MVHQMDYISLMQISVSDAKPILTDLVRRAEAGEEVVLTRHGLVVVRLVPLSPARSDPDARRALILRLGVEAARRASPGPGAAGCQALLYDPETGLPR